jgi:hypothetical protein
MFAGPRGRVYAIKAPDAGAKGVGHIPRIELLGLLRGKGHGRAGWSSALEVMTARRYVEQWAEHLFDFSASGPSPDDLRALVDELFR